MTDSFFGRILLLRVAIFAIMSPRGSPGPFVSPTAKSLFVFPSANGILGRSHGHNTVCCLGVRNEPGPYLAGLALPAVSGGGDDRRVGADGSRSDRGVC